jgi:hypothetical protein
MRHLLGDVLIMVGLFAYVGLMAWAITIVTGSKRGL